MKTKVIKGITRKIQTKQFENVDITVQIEEEIEWQDEAQRAEEMKKTTTRLMEDFTDTYNDVCNTLDVDRLIGAVNTDSKKVADKKSGTKKNIKKNTDNITSENESEEGEFDFWSK